MALPFIAKVATTNDLREGHFVYLNDADDRTRHLAEAKNLHGEVTVKKRSLRLQPVTNRKILALIR